MKLAIVADWLTTFGGAEHVLLEFTRLFPDAPIFTTVARPERLGPLSGHDIRTSRLQPLYRLMGNHQILLGRMPRAIESLDLRGYDVILSSSHAVAKGIVPPSGSVHICYCHTPVRYAWEMEDEYLKDFRIPDWLKPSVKRLLNRLRRWDLTTSKRVDVFLANSTTTQERIKRIYGRESVVVAPPVDERFFEGHTLQATSHKPYFLAVGRFVPYKRFDLLIEAANRRNLPLKIAGTGQDEARLKAMAGPSVEFLGFVPEQELPALYGNAEALLFPQEEDAGIVLLEALSCGTPVIALGKGGARDVMEEGTTGIFFDEQTVESLLDAIDRFGKLNLDRTKIREHAKKFSQERFRKAIFEQISSSTSSHAQR